MTTVFIYGQKVFASLAIAEKYLLANGWEFSKYSETRKVWIYNKRAELKGLRRIFQAEVREVPLISE